MITRRTLLAALPAVVGLASPAGAQSYPSRVIRMITPFTPGSPVDVAARLLAQHLGANLGQNVIVEPRPGASGAIEPDVDERLHLTLGRLRHRRVQELVADAEGRVAYHEVTAARQDGAPGRRQHEAEQVEAEPVEGLVQAAAHAVDPAETQRLVD